MKITYRNYISYLVLTSAALATLLSTLTPSIASEKIQISSTPADITKKSSKIQTQTKERSQTEVKEAPTKQNSDSQESVQDPELLGKENVVPLDKAKTEETAASSTEQELKTPEKEHRHGFISLKPGQKLNITGFADNQEACLALETSDPKPASFHRVQMRLSGSMCYACLHDFQEKLKLIYGVQRARIEKTTQVSIQTYSPDLANWADAVIYYDANVLNFIDLRAYMKVSGYFAYKVADKETAQLPAEDQKKI